MARYRKFDVRTWADEDFSSLDMEEKLVAIYCFTNRQVNRCGIFVFSPALAAEELGMLPETFLKRFERVKQTFGWGWDERHRVLYIPSWWKFNHPENLNVLKSCLTDLEELPRTQLFTLFSSNLAYLSETLHQTFRERLPKRYPKPTPNQEQEQEQEQEHFPSDAREATAAKKPKATAASKTPDAVLTFPTKGDPSVFCLQIALVEEWRVLFPKLDILAECRHALAWIAASQSRWRPSDDMPKFLVSWFGRSQDSVRPASNKSSSLPPPQTFRQADREDVNSFLAIAHANAVDSPQRLAAQSQNEPLQLEGETP